MAGKWAAGLKPGSHRRVRQGCGAEAPLHPYPSSRTRALSFCSFARRSARLAAGGLGLNHADGAISCRERLVRDAPDIGLGHLVHTIEITKKLTPIAVVRLVGRELLRQSFIAGEAANQVCLGARLEHLQF